MISQFFFKIIGFGFIVLLTSGTVGKWKKVKIDDNLTIMLPNPYTELDTLTQKMFISNTDSSMVTVSIPRSKNTTIKLSRPGYDDVVKGFIGTFINPTVISQKEIKVNDIISRRLNFTYLMPEGKAYVAITFTFAHGKYYAFQSLSFFNRTCNKDLDLLLKTARFKKQ